MNCNNCPYNEETYKKYKFDAEEEYVEENIWCNKVGGRIRDCGHCYEDSAVTLPKNKPSRKKKRNKRERDLKYKKHLAFLCDTVGHSAWYVDEIKFKGWWVENPKPHYERIYRSKMSKYLKNRANRRVRRYKSELHNGYHHIHKVFDFWWEYD